MATNSADGGGRELSEPAAVKPIKRVLSPSRLERRAKDWEQARELLQSGLPRRCLVQTVNEGGALLRFASLLAFLPFSHMDWRPEATEPSADAKSGKKEAFQNLVGKHVSVQVIDVDEASGRLLVSEKRATRRQKMEGLEEGQVCDGMVTGVTDYGAFVDLCDAQGQSLGVGGLVHVSELSWEPIQSAAAAVSMGERVRVKIVGIDRLRATLALSIKKSVPDPLLDTLDALLPPGDPTSRASATTALEASSAGATIPSGQTDAGEQWRGFREEPLGPPLPGLEEVCNILRQQDGVLEVSPGRQALERRVVSQDLELWLSNAPVQDGQFTLLARAGRMVQEVFVRATLDRVSMKAAVLRVSETLP